MCKINYSRKIIRKTNNKDNTDIDTDIFFANDYKAAKVCAFKYTLLEICTNCLIHTHIQTREEKTDKKKFENCSKIKRNKKFHAHT